MTAGRGYAGVLLTGVALAAMLALPVVGQESLLPPGFSQPPANRPAPSTPAPTAPAPGPAAPQASPAPQPAPSGQPRPAAPADDLAAVLGEDATAPTDIAAAAPPRYDLPPGSRRLLTRVGPLTEAGGGLQPQAFSYRGNFLIAVMNSIEAPLLSRWGGLLLRRSLLSAVDTPPTVNGADFVAARASLLLRAGESAAARMLVQSVDVDKASPRLRAVALDVYLANADPAGLCSYTATGGPPAGKADQWDLARAMCAAMGNESGTATAIVERIQRRGALPRIDTILAEKVVGAGVNGRRSVLVQWDDVTDLTPWRFGLATTTGVAIPDGLWAKAGPAMRGWALQSAMIGIDRRFSVAADAAASGVLSSRGYVDLVSFAASLDAPSDDAAALADQLRTAFVAAALTDRVAAINALGGAGYPGRVLTARAAARIGPVDLSDADARVVLEAMFAGGLDRNAMAWAPHVAVGSPAWGLLAVGSPRPLVGVTAGRIGSFANSDDSAGTLRTRLLAAALIGLDRLDRGDVTTVSRDYALGLGKATRWTRAIDQAAADGEPGTVALLVAAGLQGRDWKDLPPYHLYHITRALRLVGLGADARMIAAEALTRV